MKRNFRQVRVASLALVLGFVNDTDCLVVAFDKNFTTLIRISDTPNHIHFAPSSHVFDISSGLRDGIFQALWEG